MEDSQSQRANGRSDASDTLNRNVGSVSAEREAENADTISGAVSPASQTGDALQNASTRLGGEAAGGTVPQADDPTSPAAANERARERDEDLRASGFGDDGPASTYRS